MMNADKHGAEKRNQKNIYYRGTEPSEAAEGRGLEGLGVLGASVLGLEKTFIVLVKLYRSATSSPARPTDANSQKLRADR